MFLKALCSILLVFAGLVAFSCDRPTREVGPLQKLELMLVDSIMVDELEVLVMDDYLEEEKLFLMRGTKSRKPYLVSGEGEILQVYDLLHEGPDGLGSNGALGYSFMDKDQWIAQGLFNGYHVYNMEGKKTKLLPPIHVDIFAMSIYTYRTFFRGFKKAGKGMLIGQEQNLFNPEDIEREARQTAAYYEKVKTVFSYELEGENLQLLETYPEKWVPRKEGRFVGQSQPIVAYHRAKNEMAVLPAKGNQLFVYDYSGENPVLKHEVALQHRYRPKDVPEEIPGESNYQSYPGFTDLRYVGERLLVEFKTRIPIDIMTQLRSGSEQYYDTPEFKAAMDAYVKPYYMVVEEGKQIGILDVLPVPGALDFADENGFIYVNDNPEPQVEREYNIFYKLKFKGLE